MIRFFVRLAIAALADWLTWQISTPEMRFWRITRKYRRQIYQVINATTPLVEGLYEWFSVASESFLRYAEENELV